MPHRAFHGTIPNDRLYCLTYDMWVQQIDREVLIGATSFGLSLAGQIIAFTAKPVGATVELGRGMGTIECQKTVLAVHAPISFVLLTGNDAAEEKPDLINHDPYGAGWMARGLPTAWNAEKASLVDGAAYRRHVVALDPEASFAD